MYFMEPINVYDLFARISLVIKQRVHEEVPKIGVFKQKEIE